MKLYLLGKGILQLVKKETIVCREMKDIFVCFEQSQIQNI